MKQVTIDFDYTLTEPEVADFVKSLIKKENIEVFILTSRYDNLHLHNYTLNPTNEDMYKYLQETFNPLPFDDYVFPKEKIFHTNMKDKADFLINTNVVLHLDDDEKECFLINKLTKTKAVCVKDKNWKEKVNKILTI